MNNDLLEIESSIDETDTSEMDNKYLTFWTDNQLFGIPIAHVVQIVKMQTITEIPEYPDYAKGIINLRGSIIPLIDIRLRFNKNEAEYTEKTCIIVTDINNSNIGFIVDGVDAVTTIETDCISPPPRISSVANNDSSYVTGIGRFKDKVILLMDTQKIVGSDEINLLTSSITSSI